MNKAGGGDQRAWNCVFIFSFLFGGGGGGDNRTCAVVESVGVLVLVYHSVGIRGIGSMLGVLAGLKSLLFEFRRGHVISVRILITYGPIVQFSSSRGTCCICLVLSELRRISMAVFCAP